MSSSPSDSLPALPAEPRASPAPALPGVAALPDGFEIRQRGRLKRLLPQTTFGRSLLLIVIPLVLVQMIAAWIFFDRHWETVSYRLSADVAGDIAMVNPHLPLLNDVSCIFYGEKEGSTRATVKRLMRQTPDQWHVKQWNPPEGMKPQFTLARAEWQTCHRTVGKYSRR